MPLLDHCAKPIERRRRWESFHSYWAGAIGRGLNEVLPKRFFAAVQTHHGSRIEADVLELDSGPGPESNGQAGGVALQTYAPPQVTTVLAAVFPDEIEIPIFDEVEGDKLVAAVELISPSNKHDPASRRSFAAKCAAYQANGVGLIIVDVLHDMRFNLHDELIDLMNHSNKSRMPPETFMYVAAYRPVRRDDSNQIDCWTHALAIGDELPTLPLALRGWGCVPVDLEATYMDARQASGIPVSDT